MKHEPRMIKSNLTGDGKEGGPALMLNEALGSCAAVSLDPERRPDDADD